MTQPGNSPWPSPRLINAFLQKLSAATTQLFTHLLNVPHQPVSVPSRNPDPFGLLPSSLMVPGLCGCCSLQRGDARYRQLPWGPSSVPVLPGAEIPSEFLQALRASCSVAVVFFPRTSRCHKPSYSLFYCFSNPQEKRASRRWAGAPSPGLGSRFLCLPLSAELCCSLAEEVEANSQEALGFQNFVLWCHIYRVAPGAECWELLIFSTGCAKVRWSCWETIAQQLWKSQAVINYGY